MPLATVQDFKAYIKTDDSLVKLINRIVKDLPSLIEAHHHQNPHHSGVSHLAHSQELPLRPARGPGAGGNNHKTASIVIGNLGGASSVHSKFFLTVKCRQEVQPGGSGKATAGKRKAALAASSGSKQPHHVKQHMQQSHHHWVPISITVNHNPNVVYSLGESGESGKKTKQVSKLTSLSSIKLPAAEAFMQFMRAVSHHSDIPIDVVVQTKDQSGVSEKVANMRILPHTTTKGSEGGSVQHKLEKDLAKQVKALQGYIKKLYNVKLQASIKRTKGNQGSGIKKGASAQSHK